MKHIACALLALIPAFAAPVTVDTTKSGAPISKYIYGQFIEHLGRCIYGGIWAEMLEDRKFYWPVGAGMSLRSRVGRGSWPGRPVRRRAKARSCEERR